MPSSLLPVAAAVLVAGALFLFIGDGAGSLRDLARRRRGRGHHPHQTPSGPSRGRR